MVATPVDDVIRPGLTIYPNPFRTSINITLEAFTGPVEAMLYSSNGQLLRHLTLDQADSKIKPA
jgi:hypothetical protein